MDAQDDFRFLIRNLIILAALSFIILSPTLFFPISPDLTIFLYGGKTIAEGGSLYADFIDLKPPAMYLFMAPVYKIFGGSEIALRLFDILYQTATALSMYYVIKKRMGEEITAWSAPILYTILYASLGFGMAFQCETVIGLPLIWALYLIGGKASVRNAALAGALIGLCAGFKYTFGLLFPALVLAELLKEGDKNLRRGVYFTVFFALGLIATHSPLLNAQSFNGYLKTLNFLEVYAEGNRFVETGFKPVWKQTTAYFSDYFTLSVFSLFILGSYAIFTKDDRQIHPFYLGVIFTFVALYLSIIFEKKFFGYHWVRLYLPMSLIFAPGVLLVSRQLADMRSFNLPKKALIVVAVVAGLFFSPIFRISINAEKAIKYLTSPVEFYKMYNRYDGAIRRNITEWYYIANSLRKVMNNTDRCVIVSHGDQPLYYYLNAGTIGKFAHSGFYLRDGAGEEFRNEFIDELKSSKAIIIRTDRGDVFNLGCKESDWEVISRSPIMNSILKNRYEEYLRTENFITFVSKEI